MWPCNVRCLKASFLVWGICLVNTRPALAQCIDGTPAGYPLNEQISIHILDPDCSFDPQSRKVLADPAVEGVGLIYHESTTSPRLAFIKVNPAPGLSVSVWSVDGKVSKAAVVTNASDVAGDFSAYVLTMDDDSCSIPRVGSAVTSLDKASVAGLVRKVLAGPKCVVHVVKPSSLRQLQSIQVPQGAPAIKFSGVVSDFQLRKVSYPAPPASEAETLERLKSSAAGSPPVENSRPMYSSGPQAAGVPGSQALLVFYKNMSAYRGVINPTVQLDGVRLAKMGNKQYFGVWVDPGEHAVMVIDGCRSTPLPVEVSAGKKYFFKVGAPGTRCYQCDALSAESALAELSKGILHALEKKYVIDAQVVPDLDLKKLVQ